MKAFAVLAEKRWRRFSTCAVDYSGRRVQRITHVSEYGLALEWKAADCWIGAFVKRNAEGWNVWVCLLPCLPIHAWWYR